MADPLLTSLCTICHIEPPKYKCPRCGTRTCSLSCIKKHKNWSSCSGERDPTVYVPPSKLKTDAGIDHDYNFLTKIERSIETAEKILRDERDIIPQHEINNPHPNKKARLGKGQSRGKHTIEENSRRWDRNSLYRMRHLGIKVTCVPYGMTRSRENKTSWNKRTRTMNWQVEWLVHDATTYNSTEEPKPAPTRILHKILEETSFQTGFANSLEWYRQSRLTDEERNLEKAARKQDRREKAEKLDSFGQDSSTYVWAASFSNMQNPVSGAWDKHETGYAAQSGNDAGQGCAGDYHFFFVRPKIPARETQKLIPIEPADNMAKALPGFEVVEFPTIYVIPTGAPLPDGYALEDHPRTASSKNTRKRKNEGLVGYGSSDEDEDGAEGEEVSGDKVMADDTTSSSGSDSESEESD